ncbi:hypothetical protein BDK51DRAFT_46225 [Blyttiomyces helicus]|uniref:Uncharacterized protein n=1 Tax=Blyttiomyces helicus TaxID=388810 RepID=A0A4P9WST6_9FUNG|nr:hypothetical protein BDK51DRAFT_46225 [Blyttiomyces helicus]|eukprot:RKO94370.1 hypothetical protein BDK51DRAFT_46225 [Blyttiomyces helicus]
MPNRYDAINSANLLDPDGSLAANRAHEDARRQSRAPNPSSIPHPSPSSSPALPPSSTTPFRAPFASIPETRTPSPAPEPRPPQTPHDHTRSKYSSSAQSLQSCSKPLIQAILLDLPASRLELLLPSPPSAPRPRQRGDPVGGEEIRLAYLNMRLLRRMMRVLFAVRCWAGSALGMVPERSPEPACVPHHVLLLCKNVLIRDVLEASGV